MTSRSDIQRTYANGKLAARETLVVVFYIPKPHVDIAPCVREAVRLFAQTVSLQALNSYDDDDGNPCPLTRASLDHILDARLPGPYLNSCLELSDQGLYACDFYLNYLGNALATPHLPRQTSVLWCWTPRSYYLEQQAKMDAMIRSMALMLPFSSGYASLGVSASDRRVMQACGKRHPGLDMADPLSVSLDIGTAAAGGYWWNFLGPELTKRLGDYEAVQQKLPAGLIWELLKDNVWSLRLGDRPHAGDVNRRREPEHLRALAHFLDEQGVLHVPEYAAYFEDEHGQGDLEAVREWHRRFLPEE